MGDHVTSSNLGGGLSWDAGTRTLSVTRVNPLVYGAQRYLEASGSSDQTTSFIQYDTEVNVAPHELTLRDEDHAAGMHYWVNVSTNSTGQLTVQRPAAGSTKTISGKFAGQTITAEVSVALIASDGIVRFAPSGDNWMIY